LVDLKSLGLKEHPEIMTQGESFEDLEENMKDAYSCMVMEDVHDFLAPRFL
jgi:predicted RNase H-like HicB family nuclease